MESSRNLALEKTLLLPEATYVSLQAVGAIKEVKSTTRRPQFLSSYRASCVLVGKGREIQLFSPNQTCPKGCLYVVPNRNPRPQKYVCEACIRPDKPAWSGHHPPNEFFVFLRSGLRWMWYFLQSVWIVTASEWRWRFGQTTLKNVLYVHIDCSMAYRLSSHLLSNRQKLKSLNRWGLLPRGWPYR